MHAVPLYSMTSVDATTDTQMHTNKPHPHQAQDSPEKDVEEHIDAEGLDHCCHQHGTGQHSRTAPPLQCTLPGTLAAIPAAAVVFAAAGGEGVHQSLQ